MKLQDLGKIWRGLQGRSGLTGNSDDAADDCHRAVFRLLNRQVELAAMTALGSALNSDTNSSAQTGPETLVIAFDTNVFLRLSSHRRSDDIIDFLRTTFVGKLLLPGQVIQEFWNNQLNAVETVSASIRKHADSLRREVEKVDSGYGDFAGRFQALIDEFQSSYGYIYDDVTLRRIQLVVTLLSEKALVPFCHRDELSSTATVRKRTKTPPGFKDELDGDFFVWADLLLGVAILQTQGFSPSRIAFVTQDVKVDWSRNRVPHPILSAEMNALCGAKLEMWSLDDLANFASA